MQASKTQVSDVRFRLKPLAAGMRFVVASGMFVSAMARAELPVPVGGEGWVTSGSATNQIIGDTLRIDQQTDRAILNWQSFNVGKENTVQFVQPGSSSIALNRIYQADPSRIMGQIVANGQIYLYNANGFVFGKDSVVNTNSLLASTLNISDEVFNRGITRVFDEDGRAALGVDGSLSPATSKILIDAGAKISVDKAGRIILAAPTIDNQGSLSAGEQGQIIVAASQDKVYLQPADAQSPFAGLLVEVDTGGKVTNGGDISVRQGNITLAGFAVNQEGRVSATTSVNVNGSIRLLAQEQHTVDGGKLIASKTTRAADLGDGLGTQSKLRFATGSVTKIVADQAGGSAIDEQAQPQSYLEAQAQTVSLESRSSIVAPAGQVNITATNNPQSPNLGTTGRIDVASDASIDVSGYANIPVSMQRNVAEISVQSFDLRDAPVQKSGPLKGTTVTVDLRKGSSIVDTSGAQARIERTLIERMANGGVINLTSSGDVVVNNGATIDISGGSVDYQAGFISTTKLLTDYGRIVDISDADPNDHYVSIYGVVNEDHAKWGYNQQWTIVDQVATARYEAGYTQGMAAGSLNINAPALVWGGQLVAGTKNGINQRQPLNRADGGSFVFDSTAFVNTLQNVRFQTEKGQIDLALGDSFPFIGGQPQALILPSELINSSGVQHVIVKTLANVTVAEDANINMVAGGEFKLQAAAIDIQGQVHAAGGEINLAIAQSLSGVNLGAHSSLDVSGRWVNDFRLGFDASPVDPLIINGGTVKVSSVGDLHMKAGAKINADGGAWLAQNGRLTTGNGGDIELIADGQGHASRLYFDGEVSAAAMGNGGSLTLGSSEIVVGNGSAITANPLRLTVSNGHFDFDRQGGFAQVNLIGNLDGVTVSNGTVLDLKTASLLLDNNFINKASDSDIRSFSHLALLPEYLRQGNSLNLSSRGDVIVASNSAITTDKQGSVGLVSSLGGVYVDGRIETPGGSIRLAIEASPNAEYDNTQTVRLGEHARLLARGTSRLNAADALGRRSGQVLDGGLVSFDLQRGSLIFEQGSIVDVSGTHTVLDLSKAGINGVITAPSDVFGNAGKVDIAAAEGAVFDGKIIGLVSSDSARGGQFSFTLDRTRRSPPDEPLIAFPNNPLVVRIRDEQQPLFNSNIAFGDVIPNQFNGQAVISTNMLEQGGFADIRLNTPDNIRFEGNVSLDAAARVDLNSAVINWAALNGESSAAININSALIRLGSSLQREVSGTPVSGGATFDANARWIEVFGGTRWDGFNSLTLNSAHDLRADGLRFGAQRNFLGTLVTAANLNLKASQIYPTTLSDFTFAVKNNPTGKITVSSSGNTDQTPLSAAGTLTMDAPVIEQGGVIKAPLGSIHLKASTRLTLNDNSLTSVSGDGKIIPFGVIQAGLDWLYPLDSIRNLVFNTPPEKKLVLEAPELLMKQGSVVNLAGGGDFYGYEFLPGAGGSYDYLNPNSASYQGGFAILPSLGSGLAPFDHYENDFVGWSYDLGSQVYLDGSSVKGLAAGLYTILPAHYALLPGAFLVTPQAGSQDQSVTTYTSQGLPVVAGYFSQAGSGTHDARLSGFKIENGADIRLRSQYEEHLGNAYFKAQAAQNATALPLLAMDSGQISLIAQNKLILESQFMIDSITGGRGAKMDIAADKIHVVNSLSVNPQSGVLEILANDLSNLGVDSLLLGGARNINAQTGDTNLAVSAEEVVFAQGSRFTGKDLIAAATDKVEVQDGASLSAEGKVNTGDKVFNVSGDGAFLRVSADKQVALNRIGAPGITGQLNISAGATLSASESMLLDASKSTLLEGDIVMHQGSLNLSANSINLGEVGNLGGSALNLSNSRLLNLSVDELILTARDSIGIYGNLGRVDQNGAPVIGDGGLQDAIQFKRLVLDGAGLVGHGQIDDRARIQADTLRLQNSQNVTNHQAADGLGQIDLLGNNLEIGDGGLALQGFNAVNLQAAAQVRVDGQATLNVDANLNVTTPVVTGKGGGSLTVNMAGYDANFISATTSGYVSSGFGSKLAVTADSIDFNSQILLPSGTVELHALNGAVTLGSQAKLDLAGRAVKFADIYDYTPGGHFNVVAEQGRVTMAAGSLVNLDSGGGNVAGGELTLSAPTQSIELAGDIQASNGSASLDINHFSNGSNFDELMQALRGAGINQSIYLRTRGADIIQSAASVVEAKNLTFVADAGAITLAGHVNADGSAVGGNINLYAGDIITLQSGASLTAKGNQGGKVLLSSTDNNNNGISGIDIKADSLIDVSGATPAQGGEVTLRALRDGNGIKIQPIAGTVQGFAQQAAVYDSNNNLLEHGYRNFFAEGVKKYTDANGLLTSSDYSTIQSDTNNYMTAGNMQAVEAVLGGSIRLRAGVEVNYDGNLTLLDKWDLVDWRYSEGGDLVAMSGTLSIRASGGLSLFDSLSDGFKDGVISSIFGDIPFSDMLQSGESWSYRLVAGADLGGGDLTATSGSGNLVIGSNVSVRTGTGDMQLLAGGDFVLTDQTSTVYNGGRTTEVDPYGSLALHMAITAFPYADYPVDGGSLVINAGGDIKGAVNNSQFINDWMVRQGTQDHAEDFYLAGVAADLAALKDNAAGLAAYIETLPSQLQASIHDGYKLDTLAYTEPTTWGLVLGNGVFQQNIGSFGGGNVEINAAGNINDLSVMMPTSGKQVGTPAWDPNNLQTLSLLTNQVEVNGGGQMVVKAGGDIAGGAYYLGQGNGSMFAGGSVKGGSQFTAGPQLLLGDTKMAIQSTRDLTLGAVSDPMIMHSGDTNFFSYGDNSEVIAKSMAGDVHLGADVTKTASLVGLGATQTTLAQIYPAGLSATAFGGSVVLDNDVVLFPAPRANVNILAEQDFKSKGDASRLAMSDADRALLPTALTPVSRNNMNDAVARINPYGLAAFAHAATPIHTGDIMPVRLVTREGDITNVQVNLAKKAVIQTGRDFKNVLLQVQHDNQGDGTVFNIGRDLKFTSSRDQNGQLVPNINGINIAGPGEVLFKAGRNFDLGAAVGVATSGNLSNTALASGGAGVSVLVGLQGQQPAYVAFIDKYLGADTQYPTDAGQIKSLITGFMRDRLNNQLLSEEQAWTAFKDLSANDYLTLQPKLNALVESVYMNEVKLGGRAAAKTTDSAAKKVAYERGFTAINTLFPGENWSGDLSMFFSKIHTLDGGSINLLVPGGQVNAGLAVGTDAKKPSELGIVAQRSGDINAVIRDDFLVNQSRVFALASGDIMLWSSKGDLNAGAGAKSSIAAPPPQITFDENGNLVIVFPPIVSGSGIRTAAEAGKTPGNVDLFAPQGVVDAGEAGIGGNNVTISATAVLGANNIQVSGVGTGVPVASTGSLAAGLTGVGNLTSGVTQMAENSVGGDMSKGAANALAKAILGMLSVEVIGFGE
ncbi:MAG: filamentous hemagglutinin family protein [Methylomonas sp.]|uniref:filamentous haemagglutinin family protein n=1 Tax=Methylomonas sp. TaxID=418 RepID=UPI0025DB0F6C|nr:filamentous haemagglutinin family protein [Methylomonas sp.]MCK9606091.1 filamentous hemagglutinin family protein [Methylomonas sp.]